MNSSTSIYKKTYTRKIVISRLADCAFDVYSCPSGRLFTIGAFQYRLVQKMSILFFHCQWHFMNFQCWYTWFEFFEFSLFDLIIFLPLTFRISRHRIVIKDFLVFLGTETFSVFFEVFLITSDLFRKILNDFDDLWINNQLIYLYCS